VLNILYYSAVPVLRVTGTSRGPRDPLALIECRKFAIQKNSLKYFKTPGTFKNESSIRIRTGLFANNQVELAELQVMFHSEN
jgi:hypothetical protein